MALVKELGSFHSNSEAQVDLVRRNLSAKYGAGLYRNFARFGPLY
jgi:hypothetical protein